MNCSEGLFEEFQRVAEELVAGDEDRREDRLVTSTVVGVVAAPDFAVHDGGANRLFGEVIRGFEIRSAEEREELGGMAVEVFGEAFILGVSAVEAGQYLQLRREFIGQFTQIGASPFPFQELIASGQRLLQQRRHFARELRGSASGDLQQFVRTAEHMGHALLMRRLREAVIRCPAIVDQHAGVVGSQRIGRDLEATRTSDLEQCRLLADKHMVPSIHATDSPTRFIRPHDRRTADRRANLLVRRLALGRHPSQRSSRRAAVDRDREQMPEQLRDLAVRHSQRLVEPGDCRMSLRSQLHRRRSESIGSLQLVTTLHTLTTVLATTDMHVKATLNRLRGQLNLVLFGDVRLGHMPRTTLGTNWR